MKKSTYFLTSLASATGVLAYVAAIALLMSNGQNIFSQQSNSFLMPMLMLLLFIISAAITGLLVLGKPIHLYMGGLKKEAIILLFSTLGWLVLFLILVVAALAIF